LVRHASLSIPEQRRDGTLIRWLEREEAGADWRLIYLKATPELLASRLKKRAERFDANAAFPITAQILAQYLASFEPPSGEGEIVVDAAGPDA
jgi:gluconate kinase